MCFFTISHKKVIPDWDDLWGTIAHMGSSQTGMNMCCYDLKNNTQNLINSKCTCFLCIATTGRTMFCMVGILNVGQCGSSQPGMTHTIANHGLDLLHLRQFNLMVQHVFQHSDHKKVIPDWDDLWGTISHMGSSQSGMTSPRQTIWNLQKKQKKNLDFTFFHDFTFTFRLLRSVTVTPYQSARMFQMCASCAPLSAKNVAA